MRKKEAAITFEEKIQFIADSLLDKKADGIKAIDLRKVDGVIIDGFVVCSAPSERQVSSIAEHLRTRLKEQKESVHHIEGESTNQWVLIDTGDIVVHIFLDRVRDFYNLEKLWTHGQPVLLDSSNSSVSPELV